MGDFGIRNQLVRSLSVGFHEDFMDDSRLLYIRLRAMPLLKTGDPDCENPQSYTVTLKLPPEDSKEYDGIMSVVGALRHLLSKFHSPEPGGDHKYYSGSGDNR